MNTRQHLNLHHPLPSLTEYQKGVYYALRSSVIFNLPSYIKTVSDNPTQFKSTLKNFLCTYAIYCLDKYFTQIIITAL
jgi:hypothetical protein